MTKADAVNGHNFRDANIARLVNMWTTTNDVDVTSFTDVEIKDFLIELAKKRAQYCVSNANASTNAKNARIAQKEALDIYRMFNPKTSRHATMTDAEREEYNGAVFLLKRLGYTI